jgi:hypothetical protein
MKRTLYSLAAMVAVIVLGGCPSTGPDFSDPNVPMEYNGRPVEVLGTIPVASSTVVISVWDHGRVDGDIISLVVNGKTIVSNHTLTATRDQFTVKLNPKGYSYVLLYAHNEGQYSPNTAALSVYDGESEQTQVLEASLETNGAYNLLVGGN